MNLKRQREAIDAFNKSLNLQPNNYDAIYFRSLCYAAINEFNNALSDLDAFLQTNPNHKDAALSKTKILQVLGSNDKALLELERLEASIGKEVEIQVMKSLVLGDLGQHDDAIQICDDLILKDKNIPEIWFNRACFKAKKGDKLGSIQDLKKAIELGGEEFIQYAKSEKDFDVLREAKEFLDLISPYHNSAFL